MSCGVCASTSWLCVCNPLTRASESLRRVTKGVVDFVFIDPPYSTHLKYSGLPECIGELDADGGGYYEAMEQVIREIHRQFLGKAMQAIEAGGGRRTQPNRHAAQSPPTYSEAGWSLET